MKEVLTSMLFIIALLVISCGDDANKDKGGKKKEVLSKVQHDASKQEEKDISENNLLKSDKTYADKKVSEPSRNAFYESNYQGGFGDKQFIEQLVEEGKILKEGQIDLEAFPASYSQPFVIPSDKAVELFIDSEKTKAFKDGNTTYIQIGLQSIGEESPSRPPLNISVILDKSGSMNDEYKIDYVKKAVKDILGLLTDKDKVSIITYSDTAEVLLPSKTIKNASEVKNIIDNIMPGGGTNISEGLRLAYDELKKYKTKDAINLCLLLSDGKANRGIVDPNYLRGLSHKQFKRDIQTTTIGVGIDFNESLLKDIALSGKGNYHFIKKSANVSSILKRELNKLTNISAQALRLRIKLNEKIKLVRVMGSDILTESEISEIKETETYIDKKLEKELDIKKNRETEDEEGLKFIIPNFFMGDAHIILIEVEIPAGNDDIKVCDVFLKYKDLVFKENRELKKSLILPYVNTKEEVLSSTNRYVKKNVIGTHVGECLIRAGHLLSEGQISDAVRLLDEHIILVHNASQKWLDKDLKGDAVFLAQYRKVLEPYINETKYDEGTQKYLSKALGYLGYKRFQE